MDKITSRCLLEAGLIDWSGLTDDDGTVIAYSRDLAEKLVTEPHFRRFRDAVLYACTVVGNDGVASLEASAGN